MTTSQAQIDTVNARAREIAAAPKKATYAPGILASSKSYQIDPLNIDTMEGHNPRFDFGDIDALAAQIEEQHRKDGVGILTALVVRRNPDPAKMGRFDLVSGERRLKAVMQLIAKGVVFDAGIPADILDKKTTPAEMLIRDLISNAGKALLPLEEAHAFRRLRDTGMTLDQIAQATARGLHHVRVSLKMLETDDEVLAAVKDGTIGVTLAKELGDKLAGDKEAQREAVRAVRAAGKDKKAKAAAKKAVKGKVRETQEKKAERAGRTLKMRALTDEQLSELGAKVSKCLDELIKDAGFPDNEKLLAACGSDNNLAAAFTLGALQALKAAAGMKINLKL